MKITKSGKKGTYSCKNIMMLVIDLFKMGNNNSYYILTDYKNCSSNITNNFLDCDLSTLYFQKYYKCIILAIVNISYCY